MARNHVPLLLASTLAALALGSLPARAQLTERWWAFPGGGGIGSTGGAFRLSGAAGQVSAPPMSGGVYRMTGGFWSQPLGDFADAPPEAVPTAFALAPPEPNPFRGSMALSFDVPARGRVLAEVFDVRGRRVRTLVDETREAGRYRESWDGTDAAGQAVSPAIYFVRVRAGETAATRRVVHVN